MGDEKRLPFETPLGPEAEKFVDELAAQVAKDTAPSHEAFVKWVIKADIRRMPKDRFRSWRTRPREITWAEWSPEALYRRTTKRIHTIGEDPKYAWRAMSSEPAGQLAKTALVRMGRTALGAAAGLASSAPIANLLPPPWNIAVMAAGALIGTGGEKAAREVLRGKTGNPTYGWKEFLLDLIAAILRTTNGGGKKP